MIGVFTAKLKEIGVSKSKAGNPMIAAIITCFPTVEQIEKAQAEGVTNVDPFDLSYYAQLSGEHVDKTFDALSCFGFEIDPKTLEMQLACGTGWDTSKEFQVTVEAEEYNGKMRDRIKYVNEIGSASIKKLEPKEATILMKGLDVTGSLMAYIQNKGKPKDSKKGPDLSKTTAQAPVIDPADIPF